MNFIRVEFRGKYLTTLLEETFLRGGATAPPWLIPRKIFELTWQRCIFTIRKPPNQGRIKVIQGPRLDRAGRPMGVARIKSRGSNQGAGSGRHHGWRREFFWKCRMDLVHFQAKILFLQIPSRPWFYGQEIVTICWSRKIFESAEWIWCIFSLKFWSSRYCQ